MDLERRLKRVLNAIEDAASSLQSARRSAGYTQHDIDRALRELDDAETDVRRALREIRNS